MKSTRLTLETPTSEAFQLKKTQVQALKKLQIHTIKDVLYHFPRRFEKEAQHISQTKPHQTNEKVFFEGRISSIRMRKTRGKKQMMIAEAGIETNKGPIKAIWFNMPFIAKKFKEGDLVTVQGALSGTKKMYISNPTIHLVGTAEATPGEQEAVYEETKGISSLWFRTKIKEILTAIPPKELPDPIPSSIRTTLNLPSLHEALQYIHQPTTKKEYTVGHKYFSFESIFLLQLLYAYRQKKRKQAIAYPLTIHKKEIQTFIKERFPFTVTSAQKKVIDDITKDIAKNIPMTRLLQGDVGAGKTAVAAAVMYGVITATPEEKTSATPQVFYATPTELLAMQQFEAIISLFNHLPIRIALLTSKKCKVFPSKVDPTIATDISKAQLKKWIANGEIAAVIGTHALIQKDISAKRLSLVIVDEQHRFGVAQRQKIVQKSDTHTPHFLSMTATPIPRTLSMILYGDLDVSIIDELPKGRKPVKTKILKQKEKEKMYTHIREELEMGHQAYVLCPRIEETEKSNLRSVKEEYADIQKIFPAHTIGIMHGKLKPAERQETMEAFKNGEIDILVSTTVVEVGVDVPNATIMGILHAERFGLAQLHQIRGRVVRSTHQAFCYAVSDSGDETLQRLKVFEKNHSGFELAEEDLKQRGSGTLTGMRQSGMSDIAMDALQNMKLLSFAQQFAKEIIEKDPELKKHSQLKEEMERIVIGAD